MTENVILTVIGRQIDLGDDAVTEIITSAAYYYKNGKHFLIYDEPDEEGGGHTLNTIKITEERVDVIRRGSQNVRMVFEKDKQISSSYDTPAGDMLMDVYTSNIELSVEEDVVEVHIYYTLHMNGSFISECKATMRAMAKDSVRLHIDL